MPDEKKGRGVSRRTFLKGLGAGAAAASIPLAAARAGEGPPVGDLRTIGPDAVPIVLTVNAVQHKLSVEPRVTLLSALRNHLGITGPKQVCDRGACGACTVLLDDWPVNACMVLAVDAVGKRIITVEGLTPHTGLTPLQANFVKRDALQCGFCTPGMITTAEHLLATHPTPTLEEVKEGLSGNLCRCGTYPRIFQAVLDTAKGK